MSENVLTPILSEKTELKQLLLKECLKMVKEQVAHAKSAMDEAQESANEHQGAIEDKFESFREACQIQRDMFAKQLEEALTRLALLNRVVATKLNQEIMLGSIVKTDGLNYFISVSLGELKMGGNDYFVISAMSPIFKAMVNKKVGDTFEFRGKTNKIIEVF
jgi:transcription elongation GreA/GreB family factor